MRASLMIVPPRARPTRRSRCARTSHRGLEKRTPAHARRRFKRENGGFWRAQFCTEVAHPTRFARVAFAFGGQRSIQLSYGCCEGSFSRLARGRQRPNRGCFGLDWRGVALFQAKVTRSNRVGCARKASAERAGTVAARFPNGYHGRWFISPAGYPRRANEPCCSARQAICPKEYAENR